jgi:hypothetical protein
MGLSDKLFISDTVEERQIELDDGTVEVVHFKQLPNTVFERYAAWCNSADENLVASAAPRMLVHGVCDPDGTPALTQEQAERIKRPVMLKLLAALMDVNGYGKKKADALGKP